ncbi:lysozyme-like domain-containing protein [Lactifluus subvellereus]|nr:lysozyme-like domain-containing protein [Lactifluus subvellereus]
MKLFVGIHTLPLLLAAAAAVEAISLYDVVSHKRHAAHAHARDIAHPDPGKRCDSAGIAHPTSTPVKPAHKYTSHHPPSNQVAEAVVNTQSDVIHVGPGKCSPIGATAKVTKLSGPNGHIDWINCGITAHGWTPPRVEIGQLITVPLDSVRHTTFSHCSDEIIASFKKYGAEFGIPSIMLASFAMQESSCNPSTVGGAGEQGLMQITRDKCKGAPNGDCKNIDFNIRVGAKYISTVLASNNGDVFSTIGEYNGWTHGMTYDDATRAAHTSCCTCQNNLDYIHQFVNGWLQGMNAYDAGLGKYHNLDQCYQ